MRCIVKRFNLVLLLLVFATLVNCSKDDSSLDSDNSGNNGNNPSSFKYIKFRIVCGTQQQGVLADVAIYDPQTQKRLLLGGSIPGGYFCSIVKFDTNKNYRIECYQLPNKNCFLFISDFNFESWSDWWSENCNTNDMAELWACPHCSDCSNLGNSPDCWGN
ncbi:MAG: hypothetical protein IH948_04825 [Bacteroidetes bacterium]|nr:hypothetical protein [Bacteroidota bacterium]